MAVVLVDGWPTDKVEEASRLARESGINIFFVTIEGPDDSEKHQLVEANFVDKVGCCQQRCITSLKHATLKHCVMSSHRLCVGQTVTTPCRCPAGFP